MEQQEINKLKGWVKKYFDNRDKDYQVFDTESEIDLKLNYVENKGILREKLKQFINEYSDVELLNKKDAEIIDKEKFRKLQQESLSKFEEQAEKEFNKVLEEIGKLESSSILEDIFYVPKQYAKMVANGNVRGFLLYGEAGIGKTFNIMKAFREVNKEFVLLTGHITSLEFYNFLFEHKDSNIILDDVNILEDEKNLNILKSALGENRIVQYHTTSSKLRVPNRFVFNGSIIIILNHIPKHSESLRAVESRILSYKLEFDYKTKIKLIYELSKIPYKTLDSDERGRIALFIKNNSSEATENLNLRVLFLFYEFYLFNKAEWEKLALKTLKTNQEVEMILQGVSQQEWCEVTGKSRASFYNSKRKLR